jgi:hypothetical protein
MRLRRLAPLLAVVVGMAACNGLAGIADFHEVDDFDDGSQAATDAPTDARAEATAADGSLDAAVADVGKDASVDSSVSDVVAADVPDPLGPPCASPLIRLDITVIASPTMSYTGVDLHGPIAVQQSIAPGESRRICLTSGDLVDLRGLPDNGAALHQWAGTACGSASRCKFNIVVPVVATVHLD